MVDSPSEADLADATAVAVIGIACRFPGADNVDRFWTNLRDGVESVVELDDEGLLRRGADPALIGAEGYVRTQVLLDRIEDFDAGFFGYNPRDAAILDPQHRLFLECAWHALEDAGCIPGRFDGTVGVYAGSSLSGYLLANLLGGRALDSGPDSLQLIFANDKDYLATRVAYQLNLHGPALSVQTACSTSLAAVHLAAQALLSYECDAALAGGVTVRVPHGAGYQHHEGSIFSPDGHCRPFDARANGTTVGSGAGVVVLKRLADAKADGDRIDAVLLGSAVNNDGARKVGYTAPSVEGQARAIATALAVADVSPNSVSAVEAHGTGTQLGDPIEVAALGKVFGTGADRGSPVLLGSVKSNIGHLDSAAGIASFIKAVLQLRHGELVPSLNFTEPNPEIDFEHSPFRVPCATTGWKTNGSPRRIGVSSFGFGGTNVHAVLQEAPPVPSAGPARPVHVLTLSSRSKAGLDQQTDELAAVLADGATGDLPDAARTLQTARRAFRYRRVAVITGDTGPAAVADALSSRDPDRVFSRKAAAELSVCWLFPGQGSQYPGMGAGLYRDQPVYRQTVDECADLLRPELGCDLRELLNHADGDLDAAAERLRQTKLTQPALFVVQTALATLLRSWGLRPDAMLGHSIGEITAAHLAGVFDLPDALRLVAARGRLMQDQPSGAMAAVGLGEEALRGELPDGLSIAAVNGPELCVVSGSHDDVAAFQTKVTERGGQTTSLHTSHAFHSAMMRPAVDGVAELLSGITVHEPRVRFVSNRTGDWITAAQATDPSYWAGQLLDPVRFADGVGRTADMAEQVAFLEVGPGHTLTALAKVCVRGAVTATTLRAATEDTDDSAAVAGALGRLWLAGLDVDWATVDGGVPRRRVRLPGYAFQRRRYWIDARPATAGPAEPLILSATDEQAADDADAASGSVDGREPCPELDTDFVAPETDLQRLLAAIWEDLLGVAPVGLHDPFLELGGHSLLAIKVVQRVTEDLGVAIPLRRLVKAGTIAKLADLVAELDAGAGGARMPGTTATDQTDELPRAVPEPDKLYEPFPLSEMQQAQWIGRRSNFQLGNVAAQIFFEIDAGEVDLDRLQTAWNTVEARHHMLHAIVTDDGKQQILRDVGPHHISVVDLREAAAEQVETRLAKLRDRLTHGMRPADAWPLFDIVAARLPDDRTHVFVSFDLLIADIGSIRIVLRDWGLAYADPGYRFTPFELSYRDYVLTAAKVRDTAPYERSLRYWRARVAELPLPPQLPLAKNPAEISSPRFVARGRLLAEEIWERLTERGARHGLTPSTVLMAAYGAVLGSWCRQGRFTLNATVVNRFPVHPDVDELVGEFASFSLLPLDLTSGTFAEIAAALQDQSWEDLDYRYLNGVEVLRELARTRGSTAGAVMPVVFTSTLVQETEGAGQSLLGWLGEIVGEGAQTPQVWVDGAVLRMSDGIYLSWIGVDELFPDGLLGDMLDEYLRLLTALAASDEPWLSAPVSAMPVAQRVLIDKVNDTATIVPAGLLHQDILRQAEVRPAATAVIGPDRTLTFAELRSHACELANRLRSLGVGPGQLVAVSLPKGAAQVVAALGVLLAGGAYLPIGSDLPVVRQDRLLELGGCRLVLSGQESDRDSWPDGVTGVSVDISGDPGDFDVPHVAARPEDLAYVIFTSGSTGEPKGVAVSHRAALNTCRDVCDRFDVGPGDRVLGLSSLSFDLSVWDIFGVLGVGGALVLVEPGARRDPARWLELVRQHEVTVWNSVPALAQMFVDHVRGVSGSDYVPLRLTLLSGDWIPVDLPERIRAVAPDCRVVSLGGATEAAIWSILYEVGAIDPSWDSIPYGRPLRNQRFHVLNDRWQECPLHVVGELCIGGVGLADGYFGDPERTAAAFVTHPETGERLYRTGDLGCWRPDGRIEFLGREDFQVKVGGYRIELGEIESALLDHPAVQSAAVAALGERHHRRLVGYFVPTDPAAVEAPELIEGVQAHLVDRLPGYMVPPTLVALPAFPLTGNGKVDRGALPDPTAAEPSSIEIGEDDPTGLTGRLAAIVADVVGVTDVAHGKSFLETGGDSIAAVQIVTRANGEGIELTLQDLFEQPTIRYAAAAVQARSAATAGGAGARPVLPVASGQTAILARGGTRSPGGARWVSVTVEDGVDAELAGRVTAYLVNRHPALRLRLIADDDGGWTQAVDAPAEEFGYLPRIDLGALPQDRRQAALESMLAEMGDELDPVRGPVVKTALFDVGTHQRRLIWVAHPLVVDERSLPTLAEETERALADLLAGRDIDLPATGAASFTTWLRAVSRDELGKPRRDDPVAPAGELAPPTTGNRTAADAWLTEDETVELTGAAMAAYRMTLDEVCLAAVLTVLATEYEPGGTPSSARFALERDGRGEIADLDVGACVGPFTVASTAMVVLPDTAELATALVLAKDAGRAAEPVTACSEPDGPRAAVSLRWLGILPAGTRWQATQSHPIGVTAAVVGGRLRLVWAAAAGEHNLAEAAVDVLRRIGQHCRSAGPSISPNDFPLAGLDSGELARVLEGLEDATR